MDFKRWIVKVALTGLAVLGAAYLLPGVDIDDYRVAWVAALLLSVLNAFVRPLLIILTLPITIFTLGLFLLAINGFMFMLAADWIDGFHIRSMGWAMLMSVLVSVFTFILEQINNPSDRHDREE
ncbi:MAG: phage holin family protein [Bacteroidetes bacterium]|nr:phage holin family protein [Bacteroidota bacterium]